MNITLDPVFREKLIKRIEQQEFGERTGIHQSDLNYCLNKQAMRKLHPVENTDQETLLYSLGWATQRWLTGKTQDEPEVEVDGIKVTLDCVVAGDASTSPEIPWELKATYQSDNKSIEENTPWLRQIMCQCYVKKVLEARLSRFCIMGNWLWVWNGRAKPEKLAQLVEEHGENWAEHPTLQVFKLEFTQDELDRNWKWFQMRKLLYKDLLDSGELLPKGIALPSGQEYECQRCHYKVLCEGGGVDGTTSIGDARDSNDSLGSI